MCVGVCVCIGVGFCQHETRIHSRRLWFLWAKTMRAGATLLRHPWFRGLSAALTHPPCHPNLYAAPGQHGRGRPAPRVTRERVYENNTLRPIHEREMLRHWPVGDDTRPTDSTRIHMF
jgi:hypothetical protein